VRAVVLAGGHGRRMLPYTSVLPKPLMPLGGRSVLEILIEQLYRSGFTDITLSVGYLSHLIRAVLEGGGRTPPVNIEFVQEEEPLGTAGPLRLVEDLGETFLAMNGDLVTSLDVGELVDHHRRAGNTLTIAAHRRIEKIDFGILSLDGAAEPDDPVRRVIAYEEKPEFPLNVSMGVYVIERRALDWIPEGYFDFPDLVLALLSADETVGAYMYDGYWLDIGRYDDYEQAVADWTQNGGGVPLEEQSLEAQLDPLSRANSGSGSWRPSHRS
jgi:NDP-sugar pyrophosphorylase family protein